MTLSDEKISYITSKYSHRDIPIYTSDEWEVLKDLEDIEVSEIKSSFKYHLNDVLDNPEWNDPLKMPRKFDGEKLTFIKSDFKTKKSIFRILKNNIDSPLRKSVSGGNTNFCTGTGVTATLISEKDPGKFLSIKRSEDLSIYPGVHSTAPSGAFDYEDENLKDCVEREFKEELLNGKDREIEVDFYYNGAIINLILASLNISALGVVKNVPLSYFEDKELHNFEIDDVNIIKFENFEDKFNKFNMSPSGLYSIKRAKETKEELL